MTPLKQNLQAVQERLAAAAHRAGREPNEITLVAVTKTQPLDENHRILLYRKQGGEITVNLNAMGGKRVRVHIMVVGS